jgi:hypothetical protein
MLDMGLGVGARDSTESELRQLEAMKRRLGDIKAEARPCLVDFFDLLGVAEPDRVLSVAAAHVGTLDHFMRNQDVGDDENRIWITVRLAYFIAGLFLQRHGGGEWRVMSMTEVHSNHLRRTMRIVVGAFGDGTPGEIDPFEAAKRFVDQPPPRSLTATLRDYEAALAQWRFAPPPDGVAATGESSA